MALATFEGFRVGLVNQRLDADRASQKFEQVLRNHSGNIVPRNVPAGSGRRTPRFTTETVRLGYNLSVDTDESDFAIIGGPFGQFRMRLTH